MAYILAIGFIMARRALMKLNPHLRPPSLPDVMWNAQSAVDLSPHDALTHLPDRTAFETLAVRDDVPGMLRLRALKFLMTDVDTDHPQVYFMNSIRHPLHYHFAQDILGVDLDLAGFTRVTYFTENRKFLAGTILAYDNYSLSDGSPGLYSLEFWPTDPVGADHVASAFHAITAAMPFGAHKLAYHPTGDIQEQRLIRDADALAAQAVRTISTSEIFEGVVYSPLHLGEAIGRLRLMTGDDPRPANASDIVIYEILPNDLPVVAGVISAAPQTPLSHVNLRAQQNDIANAYLRNAATHPMLKDLIGQPVRMLVTPDQLEVTSVSNAAMLAALEARRPRYAQTPARNLRARTIVPLDDLALTDVDAFGAKSTNLAELRRVIDPAFVPDGFAVPFSFYHDFMTANGLYDQLQTMLADPAFKDDAQREDLLKAFRRAIKDAPMLGPMRDQFGAMHAAFPAGTTPRCRSSANNEDLIGFTGAGLYDSYTHHEDEGHIQKSIKQVWASLWNLRAFNEREFYRIDHLAAAMGVLVHPNFDDELVNGVALTRNLYFPRFEGYFVNAQVGEDLVTNPEGDQIAEEIVILQNVDAGSARVYETVYIRRSSLVKEGDTVINYIDLMVLVAQLKKIQDHFQALYHRGTDDSFAMDVEFKFDRNGLLAIKQARPWTG
ncbi:MAG: PEP/pyruvate-binding domain-containing protein [Paracoccaceae bacterium]